MLVNVATKIAKKSKKYNNIKYVNFLRFIHLKKKSGFITFTTCSTSRKQEESHSSNFYELFRFFFHHSQFFED